ncbi:protein of unknown function [Candidatus Nitrosocosmicus franklandus]|uniref:Uncharacterized protein n=1 Tax=Candidatus Nitrosocosmicus franklandianus TaxID=1798806 RepID=A0A484II15_9ARCH|nr:protein of unknown function [Candidatus Nitrosocosmicus franklandus]
MIMVDEKCKIISEPYIHNTVLVNHLLNPLISMGIIMKMGICTKIHIFSENMTL